MQSKNTYSLPIKKQDIKKYLGEDVLSHGGKLRYSVDFVCSESTPVYASLDGKVVYVKEDSKVGGPDKKYWEEGNRIVIEHAAGEYSAYEHLKFGGVLVKKGQLVKKGEQIAFSGNTGYSWEPHLHFEVFVLPDEEESEGTTVRIRFDEDLTAHEK